jgi:alkylation response protein AidB-like acyl-CoA dehydrogenase
MYTYSNKCRNWPNDNIRAMTGPGDGSPPAPATALTSDEQMLSDTVGAFADQVVRPLVREMDASASMPRALIDQLFSLGLMGMCIPETLGGAGSRFMHVVVAVEALSRVDPSVGLIVDVQNTLVVGALLRWGTPEQQQRWLPGLAARQIGAYALSEEASGSDAFSLEMTARRVDGGYRLSGRKLWITNASEADVFLVFATVDRTLRHRGITAFIVPRSTPGLSVGRKEDKLGIRASSTCEVTLDDCLVSDDQVLGQVGQGYKVAIETLNEGRIGIGAQMVGLAAGALDHALAHARERRQFGRPIAEFQAVQFQLARMAVEVESARLLVYHAARLCDAGRPLQVEAAMCKLVASETAERVASQAVNLLGATGFVKDSPVEKLYRDAKIGQIYEGTSNLQLQTIAKAMLQM